MLSKQLVKNYLTPREWKEVNKEVPDSRLIKQIGFNVKRRMRKHRALTRQRLKTVWS